MPPQASSVFLQPRGKAIVMAGCESLAESRAMAAWVLPVLEQWPQSAWHLWLADATDCRDIRAARFDGAISELSWRDINHNEPEAEGVACGIVGGRTGLVIYAHETIAAAATRALEGLVARLSCIAASDPRAAAIKSSFASLGVTAGT